MTQRQLCLSRDGHDYVFRYRPGYEAETVDEIMRLADDADAKLDWMDAAMLSFQAAQYAAADCCAAVTCASDETPEESGVRPIARSDDAMDGPCTSTNCP